MHKFIPSRHRSQGASGDWVCGDGGSERLAESIGRPGADPGFLEQGVQPQKKGTHDRGAAPASERLRREAPLKNLKIQVA
jgi:hypothetical protein